MYDLSICFSFNLEKKVSVSGFQREYRAACPGLIETKIFNIFKGKTESRHKTARSKILFFICKERIFLIYLLKEPEAILPKSITRPPEQN